MSTIIKASTSFSVVLGMLWRHRKHIIDHWKWSRVKEDWHWYTIWCEDGWETCEIPPKPTVPNVFQFLQLHICQVWKEVQCLEYGHDWESDGGWCGPDSGGDSFTCTRCSATHEITYY